MIIRTVAKFEAGHRQYGDITKCGYLHGHNWKVEFYIDAEEVNDIGYVVDFKVLKDIVKVYDHTVILYNKDSLVDVLADAGQKVYTMNTNPTAENLAEEIMVRTICLLDRVPIRLIEIKVWENDDSWASIAEVLTHDD